MFTRMNLGMYPLNFTKDLKIVRCYIINYNSGLQRYFCNSLQVKEAFVAYHPLFLWPWAFFELLEMKGFLLLYSSTLFLEKKGAKRVLCLSLMEPFMVLKGTTKGTLGNLYRFHVHTIEPLKVSQRVLGFSWTFLEVSTARVPYGTTKTSFSTLFF